MTSQPSGYPSGPAHGPAVAKLTGFKRRERTFDRSQLLCFQWIYERTGARRALFQLRTLVEASFRVVECMLYLDLLHYVSQSGRVAGQQATRHTIAFASPPGFHAP